MEEISGTIVRIIEVIMTLEDTAMIAEEIVAMKAGFTKNPTQMHLESHHKYKFLLKVFHGMCSFRKLLSTSQQLVKSNWIGRRDSIEYGFTVISKRANQQERQPSLTLTVKPKSWHFKPTMAKSSGTLIT